MAPFISVDVHIGPVTHHARAARRRAAPSVATTSCRRCRARRPSASRASTGRPTRACSCAGRRTRASPSSPPAGSIISRRRRPISARASAIPTLGPERAVVATAGIEARLTATLSAEATGFYRQFDDLIARSLAPSPPVAGALVQDGVGRSYGAQLLVRAAPWRGLSGWLSYTGGRSERRDHPTSPWRLFDYDQTHILTLVAEYAFRHWSFGTRLRWATGFPRTPVVGSYFDARDNRYDPLFGAQN